jgi:hypothetical protein
MLAVDLECQCTPLQSQAMLRLRRKTRPGLGDDTAAARNATVAPCVQAVLHQVALLPLSALLPGSTK